MVTWTVALAQFEPLPGHGDVAAMGATLESIVDRHRGLDMVVYPELHLYGGLDHLADDEHQAWLESSAEPLQNDGDGASLIGRLRELARTHGVWLIPGSLLEQGEDGRIYNTSVVIDPGGEVVSTYRKVFPWRPHEIWTAGHSFTSFDVPGVARMGVNICYDSWFPESTRQIAWQGAEVVFNLVKTTTSDRPQELVLARANAIVNQIFYLSLNTAGPPGRGMSIYVGPEGEVLEQLPDAEEAVTVLDLDLDVVRRARTEGTAGLNRPWSQFTSTDAPVQLPAYCGEITAATWSRHVASPTTTPESPEPPDETR